MTRRPVPCILALVGLAGCAVAQPERRFRDLGEPSEPALGLEGGTPAAHSDQGRDEGRTPLPGAAASGTEPPAEPVSKPRLVIYTGRFEVLVPNVADAVRRFVAEVESLEGYLAGRSNGEVRCRVPAASFQRLVAILPDLGRVLDESIESTDVTRQYRDLELRLDTALKARERLVALLERAAVVDDVLKIEAEIRRLTEEIERLRGELRYLADRVAYSTVTVNFRAEAPPVVRRSRGTYRPRFSWLSEIGVENVIERF